MRGCPELRQLNENWLYVHNRRVRMLRGGFRLCNTIYWSTGAGVRPISRLQKSYLGIWIILRNIYGNCYMGFRHHTGGCDAAPYFRIFTTPSQQKKIDKDDKYVRKVGYQNFISYWIFQILWWSIKFAQEKEPWQPIKAELSLNLRFSQPILKQ